MTKPQKSIMNTQRRKVAIDIGHARCTGARGNGLQEHEVCAGIAQLLRGELEGVGVRAEVIDFPGLSNSGDLAETVREVNAGQYALCVSLHCDSARRVVRYEKAIDLDGLEYEEPVYEDNEGARGAHVIYVSAKGALAAEAIARHLCPIMPGRAERVVKRTNLYILNKTRCAAVLVECGFLTNAHDADKLRWKAGDIAKAIARGVIDYLELNGKENGDDA